MQLRRTAKQQKFSKRNLKYLATILKEHPNSQPQKSRNLELQANISFFVEAFRSQQKYFAATKSNSISIEMFPFPRAIFEPFGTPYTNTGQCEL